MVLERTWFRGALIRTGSALPARSKEAYAFNDVSNLVRFPLCAFGMPIGRNDLILICGRSGIMTFNNQMSGYDVIALYAIWNDTLMRPLPYTPNKQITRIWQWTKIELKVRQSRPRER